MTTYQTGAAVSMRHSLLTHPLASMVSRLSLLLTVLWLQELKIMATVTLVFHTLSAVALPQLVVVMVTGIPPSVRSAMMATLSMVTVVRIAASARAASQRVMVHAILPIQPFPPQQVRSLLANRLATQILQSASPSLRILSQLRNPRYQHPPVSVLRSSSMRLSLNRAVPSLLVPLVSFHDSILLYVC